MQADIALWKQTSGPTALTDAERTMLKRNLGFSQPRNRWWPTTSFWRCTGS